VLAGLFEEGEVVRQQLCGGLGDHDVDFALDGVQSDGEVGGVRSEDGDGAARLQGVNCSLVGVGIGLVVGGEGLEGNVQAIVDLGDVLAKMLAWPAGQFKLQGAGFGIRIGSPYECQGTCVRKLPPCSACQPCLVVGGQRGSTRQLQPFCPNQKQHHPRNPWCTLQSLPASKLAMAS
jgi:hypothetical protein